MKDVGVLKKVPNAVFEYAGEIYGHRVVAYLDSVGSGRLLIKEVDQQEVETIRQIAKSAERPPDKPVKQHKPKDINTLDMFKQ